MVALDFQLIRYSAPNGSGLSTVWTPEAKKFGFQDQVPPGVHLTGKASQNIQKQPLLDDSEEVATEDHNYSLRNPWTVGAEKLAEVQQMLQMSPKRIVTVKNYRMIKRRKGLQLIDALVEEKLLSEETECLLRAQFSDFKWDLYNWKETAEYSTEMKQFACTLYLCSSKVYDYVRKILKLPHASILRTFCVFTAGKLTSSTGDDRERKHFL
ncbi:THAP domain-containing protein 9 [Fukomys damarensis]|uniref:THAP domain-containing protein 9 n=1 Tax=Fukomys damarensis TaxID=885580 RepID=A0A091E5P2_FUKDA|nr:THAP domain-containing protein 9 [Fukomys damarensis]